MTTTDPDPAPVLGQPHRICQRQNETRFREMLAAYSYRYRVASVYRRLRVTGTIALAALAPVFSVLWPQAAPTLGAVAALWLVLGRTLLDAAEQAHIDRAARIQEYFDTRLFGLPWNPDLGREELVCEDIATDARRGPRPDSDRYQDWYDDDGATPWPLDVLLCQYQNAAWGRRNHQAYVPWLAAAGAAVFLLGLALAITRHMSVSTYLVQLLLPTSPALLDLALLARDHKRHATAKQRVEDDINNLLNRYLTGEQVTATDCRKIQDAIYQLRRTGPRIPHWFYRSQRQKDTRATAASIQQLRDRIKAEAAN